MNKTLEKHERICPETNQQCQTGYCRNTCSFQEIEKHCNGKCDKSKSIFDQNCPVHGNPFNIPTYAASLPSKPVGEDATVTEQEMSSLRWLLNVSSEKPKTQLFTALDNCCDKEGISNRTHLENLWKKIKSGYAAAPQQSDEPTLTIQQALELWQDARDYYDGWLYDKRTYFLNKFGFDIDKTVK